MAGPTDRKDQVLDPITKEPLHQKRVNSLVRGLEEEPVALGSDIDGPEDANQAAAIRSRSGTQLIVHIEDPTDKTEVREKIAAAKQAWLEARGRS